jgi:hypothetical protein
MRVIEAASQTAGQRDDAARAPSGPDVISPAASPGEHQFASRLRDTLAARHALQAAHQQDARSADAETLHAARKAGGKHTVTYLASLLGDDWTLIRGYQNSYGGIGQILFSAHGVVAMTSLHLDATVHCHGDTWRAERFGHDGKLLGQTRLVDQAGRSPSTQLNQAADTLEQLLRSQGTQISVLRVVLLNHPRSRLEDHQRPAVQIFASPYDLARWLKELPKTLDRAGRRQIEHLLTPGEHDKA